MCTMSMIGDDWARRSAPDYQKIFEGWPNHASGPSRAEFDALKAELEALKKLLKAAKEYDAKTGQPDCEMDEKVALIKKFADLVGVDMSDVFGKGAVASA